MPRLIKIQWKFCFAIRFEYLVRNRRWNRKLKIIKLFEYEKRNWKKKKNNWKAEIRKTLKRTDGRVCSFLDIFLAALTIYLHYLRARSNFQLTPGPRSDLPSAPPISPIKRVAKCRYIIDQLTNDVWFV